MAKILVIDDNADVRELVKTILYLKDFEVLEASCGKEGLQISKKKFPDLIILDLMLPDMDGLTVCKEIKRNYLTQDIPILILTGRTDVVNRVKGLEAGADDYLIKPYDNMELLARVKVLLRRSGKRESTGERGTMIKVTDFEIDPSKFTLLVNGKPINLRQKEFDILYLLMKNSPKAVSRIDIFQSIWSKDEKESIRVIDMHIMGMRNKIGQPYSGRIKSIYGKGYLFSQT